MPRMSAVPTPPAPETDQTPGRTQNRKKKNRNANGDGGLYQRPDGWWVAHRVIDGQRVKKYGKTREAAQDKLNDLRKLRSGPATDASKLTVNELFDQYLEACPALNITQSAQHLYTEQFRLYWRGLLGTKLVTRLKTAHVQHATAKLLARVSASTVQSASHPLRAAFKYAVTLGYVREYENPLLKVTFPRSNAPSVNGTAKGLKQDDAQRYLAALEGDWLEAFLKTTILIGARQSELIGLHWPDVDLKAGTISIQWAMNRRTGKLERPKQHSIRYIQIPPVLIDILDKHQKKTGNTTGPVFRDEPGTGYLSHNTAYHHHVRLLTKAGVERIPFHGLRHTAASIMLGNGAGFADVAAILGHSTAATTASVYAHADPRRTRMALSTLAGILVPVTDP